MKTDLLLVPIGASYPQMREAASAAEEAGFDGLWTWDHLRDPEGRPDVAVPEVWTALSALAEVTRRIALGPLVLNVGSRHPGLLASMAATLQEVSGGRLLLGLGAGASRALPYAAEYDMLGLPVEPDRVRAQRVAEAIQVMRRLWAGDESSFAGSYYRLERPAGFLRPSQPPPVIVGGFGPRMAGIAGRHADGLNTQAAHPKLRELIRVARDEHAAVGRDSAGFIVTVFAGLGARWLSPESRERAALAAEGVHRLILLAQPPYDPERLRAAGRTLTGRG
jgi:alkanesulfonate monooxygenase SsuD/methylene tetrahydromethanopterin reductase-like flavin-dependent oxidoreductase (luciferase family)